ncbi:hypothetical protein KR018_002023 [Drosophila ironensis]|nr:hypothetical protein KR018_002023 [Drosophila ironensis]
MHRLLRFVSLVGVLFCDVNPDVIIFRTKWPKYVPEKIYKAPTEPVNLCYARVCPSKTRHITCSTKFWASTCGKKKDGVNLYLTKDYIIQVMNTIRKKVQAGYRNLPRAKRYELLSWDDSLTTLAMRVTNQCRDSSKLNDKKLCFNTQEYRDVGESSDSSQEGSHLTIIGFINSWLASSDQISQSDVLKFPADPPHRVKALANILHNRNLYVGCGMLNADKNRYVTCLFNRRVKPGDKLYLINNKPKPG